MDMPFLEAVEQGGLVCDGAMGTALYERGIFVNRNFEEVCINQPELVYQVHREYLLAGAHILETNSYGANKIRLAKFGLAEKAELINQKAVEIARRAADGAARAPLAHSVLRVVHRPQIHQLPKPNHYQHQRNIWFSQRKDVPQVQANLPHLTEPILILLLRYLVAFLSKLILQHHFVF